VELLHIVDHSCLVDEPWVHFEHRGMDRASLLQTLATLLSTSKQTCKTLGFMVMWATLRLAFQDLPLASNPLFHHKKRKFFCASSVAVRHERQGAIAQMWRT